MRRVCKKGILYIIGLFATVLSLVGLACCKQEEPKLPEVTTVAIQTEYGEYETFAGGFVYETVTLFVAYSNGETEELALQESMLSAEDREKQNELGEHLLTVTYQGFTCEFTLLVIEDLSKQIEFTSAEKIYSGAPQFLAVENLPLGTSVAYTNNGQTGVGEYLVKAEITLTGGKVMEKTATLTIVKAPLVVKAETAKTFVGYEPTFSYELIGLVGEDDESIFTVAPTRVPVEEVTAIGIYENFVAFEGARADNYQISYSSASLQILALPTLETQNGKKYLSLGEYPQTVVSNPQTVQSLDEGIASGELVADKRGYYTLNGSSYARLVSDYYANGESYGRFTDGTRIEKGKSYYFAVEPIRWQVVSEEDGVRLIAEKLLDTKPFWDIENAVTIDGVSYNPNDYSASELRKWLNGDFRMLAFGTHERALMQKTVLSGGVEENLYPNYPTGATEDYIYLPSYRDITNAQFGFSSDADRMALTTDYTRATGTYMRPSLSGEPEQIGYGQYFLRSAGYTGIREVNTVDCFGNPTKEAQSGSFIVCVRPMLCVTLSA